MSREINKTKAAMHSFIYFSRVRSFKNKKQEKDLKQVNEC